MSQRDVELVQRALGNPPLGEDTEMGDVFEDPQAFARLTAAMAADAVIEFATPDGGFVGDMAGPFRGPEGLRSGWIEWTEAWESWKFRSIEWIDVGDGRVLLLGHGHGRFAGSGLEIGTPSAALYTVRDEKIVRVQHFLDQAQARAAAGLDGT